MGDARLAAPDRTEALSPQIVPSVAGVQAVCFSFAVRFALFEPCRVWVGGYGARGEHLRVMAAGRLVRAVVCG
jgi:hypothetical protein